MIFNKKYTPRNEELKRMFSKFRAEHYSMYDTYFKNKWILRKWFKEHYNNYKPTLDQIKNFDVSSLKSSSEAANLAELKHNAAKRFAKADFHNLFSTPYSKEVRINIYKMYYLIFNI
ncbi:MAG: hypothetical protein ACK51L_01125 [bacterium]|jgi:hypothetical protein